MNFDQLETHRAITPLQGYPPHIGILVNSLEYARLKTKSRVAHLSVEALDYRHDERANSIGSLLLHIAAVEYATQDITFRSKAILDDHSLLGEWEMPLFLGERAWAELRDHPISYYFNQLDTVRAETLSVFKQLDDAWLWQESRWKRQIVANHYWQWYHVFEDEIAHRGEINWLLSRLP